MPGPGKRPTRGYAGRPAADRRAERRQRLLAAGLELFGGGPGYRGTSVAALCAKADLSTRQFYEEFGNLEEVLAVLHREGNARAEAAVLAALGTAPEGDVRARAAVAFRAYAESAATDPRRIRVLFAEVVGAGPALERQRIETRTRWVELIRAEAAAAVARGEVPDRDYRIAGYAFIAAVNGLLYDWSAGYVEATAGEITAELVHLLVGLLRPVEGSATLPQPSGGEGEKP
ncbi:TetR/AcrR family transcriptional regulator [Streptomyces boninensis]|uniref:TetR/AcrR family transcriptional regulator n=1 Tax=Streptomyces boninensis TaxID=2039455 RepID=UPI003B213C0C